MYQVFVESSRYGGLLHGFVGIEDDAFLTGQDSTILDLTACKARILRQGSITREDILAKIPEIPFEEV